MNELRECPTHGLTKFISEKNKGMREGRVWRCYQCRNTQKRESRQRKKLKLVEEAGGRCVLCGYNACMRALDFHHRDPEIKEFTVSQKMKWSVERLRDEVSKCVLLCKNCHCEVEDGLVEIS